jgi:hypothetical protein
MPSWCKRVAVVVEEEEEEEEEPSVSSLRRVRSMAREDVAVVVVVAVAAAVVVAKAFLVLDFLLGMVQKNAETVFLLLLVRRRIDLLSVRVVGVGLHAW